MLFIDLRILPGELQNLGTGKATQLNDPRLPEPMSYSFFVT